MNHSRVSLKNRSRDDPRTPFKDRCTKSLTKFPSDCSLEAFPEVSLAILQRVSSLQEFLLRYLTRTLSGVAQGTYARVFLESFPDCSQKKTSPEAVSIIPPEFPQAIRPKVSIEFPSLLVQSSVE